MTLACETCFATGVPGSDAGTPETILEISAVGITVDPGKDLQESYTLTDRTTATLGGLPVKPADPRPGMVASIVLANDGKTIVALHAAGSEGDQEAESAFQRGLVDQIAR